MEFPLPAAPSGLVALEGGAVVTRAGDVLAILEPYKAPGEVLRGPSDRALTIGDVTLERRA